LLDFSEIGDASVAVFKNFSNKVKVFIFYGFSSFIFERDFINRLLEPL